MNLVETYLRELRDIRSTGAAARETSYYAALANLLNDVGKGLKPRVRYELTYDDKDLPTHYAFKVRSKLGDLKRQYERLSQLTPEALAKLRTRQDDRPALTPALEAEVRSVIAALDDRGAWVEAGPLRYHGKDNVVGRIIDSATFIRNVGILSRYLAATRK